MSLKLDYKPIVQTDEQFIVGIFDTAEAEFVEIKLGTSWSSGRVAIKNKKFSLDIPLNEGYGEDDEMDTKPAERFEFSITVFGKNGVILPSNVPSFVVVKGLAVEDFIVAHTIGLKKDDGKFEPIIEKGERYPIKKTKTLKYVENSDSDIAFILEIIEIDELADTASFMKASFGVTQQINEVKKFDLKDKIPNGTEIKVQYELDKSGNLTSSVYIQAIDQLFQFKKTTRIVGDDMENNSLISMDFQLIQIRQMKKDSSYILNQPELNNIEKKLLGLKKQYEQQDEVLDIDQVSKFDHECREIDKEIQKIKMSTQGIGFEIIEESMKKQYEIATNLDAIGCDTRILRQEIAKLSVVNIDKEEQGSVIQKETINLINSNFNLQKQLFAINVQTLQQSEFTDMQQATILIQSGRDYIARGDSQGLARINSQLRNISAEDGGGSNDSPINWLTGLK